MKAREVDCVGRACGHRDLIGGRAADLQQLAGLVHHDVAVLAVGVVAALAGGDDTPLPGRVDPVHLGARAGVEGPAVIRPEQPHVLVAERVAERVEIANARTAQICVALSVKNSSGCYVAKWHSRDHATRISSSMSNMSINMHVVRPIG